MIGIIDVECQALNPNMPLHPMRAYVGSPSSIRVRNVPRRIGDWCIRNVYFTAIYPDGTIKTSNCVLVGGVWVGTIEGTQTSGISQNGYTIFADGTDENGNNVTGYVLGKGDIEILEADGQLNPDTTRYYVHLLSALATQPREGDMFPTSSGYMIWQEGEAHQLGTPFDEISTYVDSAISSKADMSAIHQDYIIDVNENRINADRSVSFIGDGTPYWVIVQSSTTIPQRYQLSGTKTNSSYYPTGVIYDGEWQINLGYNQGWQVEIRSWDAGLQQWNEPFYYYDYQSGLDATELNFGGFISSCVWTTPQIVMNDNLVMENDLSSKQDALSNDQLSAIDNALYDIQTKISYADGGTVDMFVSPTRLSREVLQEIGVFDIASNTWLKEPRFVEVGSNVLQIDSNLFMNATKLLTFKANYITSMFGQAFSGCSALTSVTIPNLISFSGANVFNGCTSLTSLTVPKTVTSVARGTFTGNSFQEVIFEGKTLAQVKAMTNYSRWGLAENKILTYVFEQNLSAMLSAFEARIAALENN